MVIILFETFLLALAFGLAFWWDVDLLGRIEPTRAAAMLGIAAAILPNLALALAAWASRGEWMADLRERTARLMRRVFGVRPGLVAALAVAYGGAAEEFLFRGVLVPALGQYVTVWPAVVLVGVAFGLLHPVSRLYVVLASLLGIFWGALYVWTGNLLVPVIAHAFNNVIALAYYSRTSR